MIIMTQTLKKIIVILGPTAYGKSSLAIKLAAKFKGEIVNADSRQIYREMNIGTGKTDSLDSKIRHHLLDIIAPKIGKTNTCQTFFSIKKTGSKNCKNHRSV